MKFTQNELFVFLLKCIAVAWPFFIVGFVAGGYPVNLPFVSFLFFFFAICLTMRFRKDLQLFLVIVLILYLLLSVLLSGSKSSSILSVFVLSFFLLSLTNSIKLDHARKRKILQYLKIGFFIAVTFQLCEILYYMAFANKIQYLVPINVARRFVAGVASWETPRFHSFFDEPAHFAIYLVFVHAIFDQAHKYGIATYSRFTKSILIVSLLLTQSLGGIFLILAYFSILSPLSGASRTSVATIFRYYLTAFFLGIALFAIFSAFFPSNANRIIYRALRVVNIMDENSFESEGARVNAYLVALEHFEQEEVLFGVGYGNVSPILSKYYGHEGDRVANAFVNMLLQLGFIGFFLYCLAVLFWLKKLPSPIFCLFLLVHLFLGYYLSYMFWFPIIIAKVLFDEKKTLVYNSK